MAKNSIIGFEFCDTLEGMEHDQPASKVKRARLESFRAGIDDNSMIDFWRKASAAQHAQAMIELSNYAQRMLLQRNSPRIAAEPLPSLPVPRASQS